MSSTNRRYKAKLANTVEPAVCDYLRRHKIPRGSHILVACSGGPDSVCLLNALSAVRPDWGFRLSCVYLDHGIRSSKETAKEEQLVRRICAELNIDCWSEAIPRGICAREAEEKRRSLEDVAREKRYGQLLGLLKREHADYLAVGHTLDDQTETLIMRFFQGSGINGLSGIPEKRGNIIRPILSCARKEVAAYLEERKMGYCVDHSNLGVQFLRNRIRHVLLPVIEQVFPGYRRSLSVLASKMGSHKDFLEKEVAARSPWEPLSDAYPRGYKALGRQYLCLPAALRLHMLYDLSDDILQVEGRRSLRIPYPFFAPVLNRGWFFPKRTLLRGYGLKLYWKGESLFLERDVVGLGKKGYLIEVKDQDMIEIADTGLVVSVSPGRNETEGGFRYAPQAVKRPLVVRSRRPGDTIAINTGKKSVKKILSEWKVPLDRRWMVPLVADQRGVLAVMGKCLGFPNKISAELPKKYNADGLSLTINNNRGISSNMAFSEGISEDFLGE